MASAQSEDVARRGGKIYEERLRAILEPAHRNQFVAIEPDSGDHFLGDTTSEVVAAARKAHPDRLSLVQRIGHPATYYLGTVGHEFVDGSLQPSTNPTSLNQQERMTP